MKKLTVFMMIAALALFIAPVIASAGDDGWTNFHGTYQMSASGSCLHSSEPYYQNTLRNNWWTAPAESKVYAGAAVANGTWIFEDGGGTYSQTIYATILPGGAASMPVGVGGSDVPVPLEVRVLPSSNVPFTYAITPSGDITVTTGGIELIGSISIDKKTITLLSANNVQHFGGLFQYTICNFARTLIKVGE
jgi:hypothetical protein